MSSPDGRNAILNLISAGEIFGEVALLDGRERTADATANTNCEIFVIDRRDFLPFVRSQPTLATRRMAESWHTAKHPGNLRRTNTPGTRRRPPREPARRWMTILTSAGRQW